MVGKGLSEQAAEKRRAYKRAWYAKNREKCREHTRRYWEKRVLSDGLDAGQEVEQCNNNQ
jgi:hypothetical protein